MTTETLLQAKRREYNQAYYLLNKERIKQQCHDRYIANREEVIQKSKEWAEVNPERKGEINAKWAKANPDKRRVIEERWKEDNPEEYRQTMIRGAKKARAKRKGMGFKPLNERFDGSHAHHINNDQVIHIPEEMHKRRHNLRTGEGMAEMNALAFQYLFEHT